MNEDITACKNIQADVDQIYEYVATLICDCLSKNLPSSHLPVFREIPF